MATLRLGVLFSGGGRTLVNFEEQVRARALDAEIAVAVSSHAGAGGIGKARSLGISCEVVDYRQVKGSEFSERIAGLLDAARADLVCLAGFIRLFQIPARYEGRVMNIHPALLPAFGGKGFYGDRVHEAVLSSGAKFSGCTVHFVTSRYDEGPIILQRVVPVRPGDAPHDLAERVFAEERIAYPDAVRLFAAGKLAVDGGKVLLRS